MNNTQTQKLSSKVVGVELLKNVQTLYQNGEIDVATKNKIANEVRTAIQTDDFEGLKQIFKNLAFGSLFPEITRRCVELCTR